MKPRKRRGPGSLLDAEAKAAVVREYRSGARVIEIADRYRTNASTVDALARAAGLPPRRKRPFNVGIPRRP
jgi:transposase-like protein